jgi:hypothetical protein
MEVRLTYYSFRIATVCLLHGLGRPRLVKSSCLLSRLARILALACAWSSSRDVEVESTEVTGAETTNEEETNTRGKALKRMLKGLSYRIREILQYM